MSKQVIKNVRIVLKDQIIQDHQILIEDGKIAAISKDNLESENCAVVNGEGLYLSPGFIDIHTHGCVSFDAMDATIEALEGIARFHVKNGVTGFLATTMTESNASILSAIDNVVEYSQQDHEGCSQLLGIYQEGPYFSVEKKGAQNEAYIADINMDEIKEYVERTKGLMKIIALAPEKEGAGEAIAYLCENNIVVSTGHSMATYEETMKGIEAGVSEATHMFNGMRNFSHREPGIIGACLLDDRVTCEMICDGIHLHPAAIAMIVKAKGDDRAVLISDSMKATGMPDGECIFGGQKVIVKDNTARLLNGALAGSTLCLNRAVRNTVKMAGVELHSAVKMASLNAARQAGLSDTKGSIEVGKDADLILFDDDVNIKKTFIMGEMVYEQASEIG